jgi:hypothetical protein
MESRLAKARSIKQAMMQELLTGRIRLVQPGSNVIPLPVKPAAVNQPPSQPAHNWQINEAVVIGVLAQRFGNEKFPLPRKRRVKLMYLLHRHAEGCAKGYLKKAAGPYDPNTKYKGPEAIALKNGYYRVMLGRKSMHASECFAGGFVGTDYGIHQDLTGKLPDAWRDFNKAWIPVVEGAIIALDDDQKLRWALAAVPSIAFYRYQISFKLTKV